MDKSFVPVLLGGDQNVYGMARSFYEGYGVKSVCIAKVNFPVVKNSKILTCNAVENFDRPDIFVSALRELALTLDGPRLLISCGDNYTRLLSQNQEQLKDLYHFCVPKTELIDALCQKENFYRVCDEYGLSYPKTQICTFEKKDSFELEIQLPVIVKASDSVSYWKCSFPGKKKVFLASDTKEFFAILNAIYSSSYREDLIVQEYIPGEDCQMRVINAYCKKGGGVSYISLGHIILEEHTAQGIGSYAAIMGTEDDSLCLTVKEFLEKIGYEGYVNIDLKKDPRNGRYYFFEINPRQGRSSYFVTASGDNLASLVTQDLIMKEPGEFRIGRGRCVWTIVPKGILYKYVKDAEVRKEISRQIQEGGLIRHLRFRADRSFKKTLSYWVNQYHYYKKYRENFNNKGYF